MVLVDLFSETGGLPLLKRHPVRQRYRFVELQRWRDKRGLNFHLQPAKLAVQCPPRRWRRDRGDRGRPRSRAVFAPRAFPAVWEDQLSLADPAVLAKLADDTGLPGKELIERSGSEAIEAAYEQNRQDALTTDVFGSPAYVLDGEVFWGTGPDRIARRRV